MKLTRKQMVGLGTALQMGGALAQALDSDRSGLDDEFGRAASTAGIALSQLSNGESVSRKGKAAEALRAIATACNSIADDLEAK
jgi:hypothetical protein